MFEKEGIVEDILVEDMQETCDVDDYEENLEKDFEEEEIPYLIEDKNILYAVRGHDIEHRKNTVNNILLEEGRKGLAYYEKGIHLEFYALKLKMDMIVLDEGYTDMFESFRYQLSVLNEIIQYIFSIYPDGKYSEFQR